jgi:hypothetical protein
VFAGNRFFNTLLDAEGGISRGVEVLRSVVEGSFLSSPLLDFVDLSHSMMYHFVAVALTNVNDMAERRDHVDVNASELVDNYPSSETEFWNDIC